MTYNNYLIFAISAFAFSSLAIADSNEPEPSFFDELKDLTEIHGFYEMRGGYRLQNDKYEKDMSIMENRFQLDSYSSFDWGDVTVRGDTIGDLVTEKGDFDLREANVFARPTDYMDLKIGRQILTWGTGDLLFINDMFPKDWQSFFIGRDTEYLKAPSDAAKISLFSDAVNADIVFTPQFDPDRFINGSRISYWNTILGRSAGEDAIIHTNRPDEFFKDIEIALRLYRNIDNYELALYGYHGFWKSPGGYDSSMLQALFPDLNVYGASIRGVVGKGIGNAEIGYYDSADDTSGKNPLINNSEMRYLLGYTQEIGKDLTLGLQYYIEEMLDYCSYRDTANARERYRHLTTVRLTKLLMNQNLQCSLFAYFSPTDRDVYLRPNVNYKVNDNTALEAGGNIFFGDYPDTFFGQFEDNSNIYYFHE